MAQDLEFGGRQADPPVATLDAPPLEVDEQVAMADDPPADGVGQFAVRPPQERLDPAHQLAQPERLGQVVIGTQLEADHLVDLVVAGGQDEDRHLGPGRPQAAEDLEAVHPGQPTSSTTRSGAWRVAISRPSSPDRATATSYPPAGGRTGCRGRPRVRLRR